jgi:glycerol-3-phosphate dehydrogenase
MLFLIFMIKCIVQDIHYILYILSCIKNCFLLRHSRVYNSNNCHTICWMKKGVEILQPMHYSQIINKNRETNIVLLIKSSNHWAWIVSQKIITLAIVIFNHKNWNRLLNYIFTKTFTPNLRDGVIEYNICNMLTDYYRNVSLVTFLKNNLTNSVNYFKWWIMIEFMFPSFWVPYVVMHDSV